MAASDLPFNLLQVEGKCRVVADPGALAMVIHRLLRWLTQRSRSSSTVPTPIHVAFEQDEEGTRIAFRDASRRLPPHLREHAFLPFADSSPRTLVAEEREPDGAGTFLSLYLSRALMEVKNCGYLEDHTEEMESGEGHFFVVGLPPSKLSSSESTSTMSA